MAGEWMSLSEVANMLGVHPSTVRNWSNEDRIPVHRTQGGHRRYRLSEIEIWQQARDQVGANDTAQFIQHTLKHIRLQLSLSHLEEESWYQKLDLEARTKYGHSGRLLMQGLNAYLASSGDSAQAESRAMGFEYATLGHRYELSRQEAVCAYLFFRNSLLEGMFSIYENSTITSAKAWHEMLHKTLIFTDQILLTLLENYQTYD